MQFTQQTLDLLVCPVCHGRLALAADHIACLICTRRYPIVDGLPVLIASRATLPPASEQL
jgi:uncharacterized protein YbaR (Trm112 family)